MVERRIIDVRPVDAGHQVLSVESDGHHRLRPCGGCPWRVDRTGQFPPGAFLQSARVAEDLATSTFGCHEAPPSRPRTCAGFIVAHRDEHNLALRRRIATGDLDPDQVADGGHELYGGYLSMAIGNGMDPADAGLARCRPTRAELDGGGDPRTHTDDNCAHS